MEEEVPRPGKPDALDSLIDELYGHDPEALERIERHEENGRIAMDLYALRKEHGLTQAELARKVGTNPAVICRLEDEEYEGHSVRMLRRIADALE
jgi:DNA-binding XRE family transcriptional regulator